MRIYKSEEKRKLPLWRIAKQIPGKFVDRGKLAGRGYLSCTSTPEQEPSIARGEEFYQTSCQTCHGQNGEEIKRADGRLAPATLGRKLIQLGLGVPSKHRRVLHLWKRTAWERPTAFNSGCMGCGAFVRQSPWTPTRPTIQRVVLQAMPSVTTTTKVHYSKEVDGDAVGFQKRTKVEAIHEHWSRIWRPLFSRVPELLTPAIAKHCKSVFAGRIKGARSCDDLAPFVV